MGRRVRTVFLAQLTVVLLLSSLPVAAQARLPVLEFFGRPTGAYCQAAGPAMTTLQAELQGQAILLEYHFDSFRSGRLDRFNRAAPAAPYLPLVMVDSGAGTSHGPVEYESEYRALLETELARPPQAVITSWWRRMGDSVRVYVTAQHLGDEPLGNDPWLWAILWEEADIGVSNAWVHAAVPYAVAAPGQPGERIVAVLDTPVLDEVGWSNVRALALLEHLDGGSDCYDMLQAAVAAPADLGVSPGQLHLDLEQPAAEITLDGPHVLAWTATPQGPWFEVIPDSGSSLPAEVTVRLRGKSLPASTTTAGIRFDATGDGMSFTTTVTTTIAGGTRHVGRRVAPASGE